MLEIIRERDKVIMEANKKRISEGLQPIPECVSPNCSKLRDATPGMGADTSCPYHRLLFDHWLYNVIGTDIDKYKTRRGRRSAVTQWINRTGKEKCDKIVDEMSRVGINWMC